MFEEAAWQALKQIPPGQTRSYGDIAKVLGQPEKSRMVGQAKGANKVSLVVPCHRVIGSDGSLVGYGGGLWRKNGFWITSEGTRGCHSNISRRVLHSIMINPHSLGGQRLS